MKRATKILSGKKSAQAISIHALVKRATVDFKNLLVNVIISIHALVKRATAVFPRIGKSADNFNPRPREEGDHLF